MCLNYSLELAPVGKLSLSLKLRVVLGLLPVDGIQLSRVQSSAKGYTDMDTDEYSRPSSRRCGR